MADFVPKNMAFHHINRDNIIKNHTTTIAKELIRSSKDVVIVVADGTYLYVQVSSSNSNSFTVFFAERTISEKWK